ncbi:LOW QUALITY PROTEIN: hypothetical protein V2J09_008226 [Rumex salicifolius]
MDDRNTKFFHLSMIIRRRRNKILALHVVEENWENNQGRLEHMSISSLSYTLSQHNSSIYSNAWRWLPNDPCRGYEPPLPFDKEIWDVFRVMNSFKAPDIDGFQPAFYKVCWSIVGASVCTFIPIECHLDFFGDDPISW